MSGRLARFPLDRGEVRQKTHTNPGAGNNFSYEIPAGEIWLVCSIFVHFDTDANAANRWLLTQLSNDVPLEYWHVVMHNTSIAAGTYNEFSGGLKAGGFVERTIMAGATPMKINSFPLPEVYLVGGDHIKVNVANIQVGDQLNQVRTSALVWHDV